MSNNGVGQESHDPKVPIPIESEFIEGEEGEYIRSSSNFVYDTMRSGVDEGDPGDEEDSVDDLDEIEQRKLVVSRAFEQGTQFMSIELVLKGMLNCSTA